jgi:hypothetical protein
LVYFEGMTNDIITSPAASFDRDSVPDMSMRTGELRMHAAHSRQHWVCEKGL